MSKCVVRALKDEKVPGKEPGKGVLVEQTARAKALRCSGKGRGSRGG